jgi:hypothetical protein
MRRRLFICGSIATGLAGQPKYSGPKPSKKDLPYIVHGDNLVQTEAVKAEQHDQNGETLYVIPGESAPARTPLASPIFLIDADRVTPQKLQLYRLEQKNGHREITFRKGRGDNPPVLMTVTGLGGSLYRLEVVNDVANGEYSLTTEGSNQAYCFSVF